MRLYRYGSMIVLFLLSACQAPTTYTPQVTDEELAREEAYQRQMVEEAAKRGGAPRPWRKRKGITAQFERVADRIDKAGAQVCQEMGLPQRGARCYYYFRLKSDNELNAHADGENIVIYSGMMHFLENDDEVALAMGHELAHNLMGHVDAGQQNVAIGAILGVMVDAVAASQGVSTGVSAMDTGAQIGQMSYSVEFEEEADYVGLYIAARAGYDIRRAPELWRRMSIENPKNIYNAYTHPSNARRFAALQRGIYEIEYKRKHRIALIPDFKEDVTN